MQSRFCCLKKLYCALRDRKELCLSKKAFQQLLLQMFVSNEDSCRKQVTDIHDSQEPNQHLTDFSTFEGSESKVRRDHTGQPCRQETLLMLSCVTLLVESGQHSGVGRCPGTGCSDVGLSSAQSAGGSHEDCHLESKSRHLYEDVIEGSLTDGLKEINILSVLLKLSQSSDRFIKYAASKTILAVVKCPLFNSVRESFVEEVMSGVINSSQALVRISNMELLKHFMSSRHGQDVNTWCHQHLTSCHILKAEYVQTTLKYKEHQSVDELITFLTLLQKTVKFVNKFEKELKESHLKTLLDSNQKHLIQFLVRSLQYIDKPEWRSVCKKTLDIFNTFLHYGSHLAVRKEITSLYSEMSERLLSDVCPSALTSAPYVRQFVCFGGIHVQGTLTESQNGDLALLRKLILVLLKSCAITVRGTTQVPSRQKLVSTCLDSVSQFMQKTFDAGDLLWLPLVFQDQDDAWVEVLLCLLDIYVNTMRLSPDLSRSLSHKVNPHPIFLEFIDSSDHMVLVDLLTSPETCFLLYLLQYLKCLVCEWDKFVTACHLRFCVSQNELMDLELSEDTGSRLSDHPEQEVCDSITAEHSQLTEDRYKRLQKSVKTDLPDGRECTSSVSSEMSPGALTSSLTQPFPKHSSTPQPNPTQSTTLQPFFTLSSTTQPFPTQSTTPQPFPTQSTTPQPFPTLSSTPQPFPTQSTTPQPFPTLSSTPQPFPTESTTPQPFPTLSSTPQPFPTQSTTPQPFPTLSSTPQPFPTQSCAPQPFPTQSSAPLPSQTQSSTSQQSQVRGHCSALSYLAAYDDDDDDDDDGGDGNICSSATTLTDGVALTPGTMPFAVEDSTMSCELQCVENVMSELIRVGLRIERLSSQDLFPYNPGPLLSLLERCERLYDGMMAAHRHVQ
ncbi:uncharacterized protein [Haliotis asinina]|uniref:uncharacterized protein n=1 Tax=Haliotis asinina TaxID=109174 RepID=UPI003532001E